ncbi:MAG: SDR family oxidoreductase [Planctomycetota bacterium]
MLIAVTGATGFLGRYIVNHLASAGHACRCWYRPGSDQGGFEAVEQQIEWLPGELGNPGAGTRLVDGCDAVVHAALYHPGGGFRGEEGNVLEFVEKNVLGTLKLIEAARQAGVGRFVFISTCAVHEKILDDRPLDETHPTWATSHYGAHKAAIEQFVRSYGFGQGYPICALRPTGIYGITRPVENSKWFDLVRAVARGQMVDCRRGGKEVHAADVARAVEILLSAEGIAGEVYNCYDRYVSEYEVATIAKELSGSKSEIRGVPTVPKHEIITEKLRQSGMGFGGRPLLEQTIGNMLDVI